MNRRTSDVGYFSPAEETDTEIAREEGVHKFSLKTDKIIEKDEIKIHEKFMNEYTSLPKDGKGKAFI